MLVATGPLPVQQATALVGQETLEALRGARPRPAVHGWQRSAGDGEPTGDQRLLQAPAAVRAQHSPATADRGSARHGQQRGAGGAAHHPHVEFADVIPQPEIPLLARAFRDAFEQDLNQTWAAWQGAKGPAEAARALELRLTGDAPAGQIEEIISRTDVADAHPTIAPCISATCGHGGEPARSCHSRRSRTHSAGDHDLGEPLAIEALLIGFRAERTEITPAALERIGEIAQHPGLAGEVGGSSTSPCTRWEAARARRSPGLHSCQPPDGCPASRPRSGASRSSHPAGPRKPSNGPPPSFSVAREHFDRSAMVAQAYVAVMALLTMSRYADATAAGSIVASGQFQAANLLFGPDRALMNALAIAARRSGRPGAVGTLIERGSRYTGRSDALPMGRARLSRGARHRDRRGTRRNRAQIPGARRRPRGTGVRVLRSRIHDACAAHRLRP